MLRFWVQRVARPGHSQEHGAINICFLLPHPEGNSGKFKDGYQQLSYTSDATQEAGGIFISITLFSTAPSHTLTLNLSFSLTLK